MNSLTVLLVDDDPEDAMFVEDALEETCDVTHVLSLQEALDAVDDLDPDVVLLDLTLPDARQLEGVKRFREEHPTRAVVCLTGLNSSEIAVQAVALGAQDYVTKGLYDEEQLHRTLTYAVQRNALAVTNTRLVHTLKESQAMMRALADSSPDAIFRLRLGDAPGVEYANLAAIEMFGLPDVDGEWSPEALLARVHPDDRAEVESARTAPGQEGTATRFRVGEGEAWSWVEEALTALHDTSGTVVAVQATARDVSEQKAREETLQNALVEQREMNEAIRGEKLESIGRLAAGIAHEMNTPIQFVSDNSRFIQRSVEELQPVLEALRDADPATLPEPLRSALAEVDVDFLVDEIPISIAESLDGLERVATLVKAMKEFSHPGSDDHRPEDLNRVINTTTTMARNEWKYIANLHLELDEDLPTVVCVGDQIGQVVLNLVVNAAQAIDEHRPAEQHGVTGNITVASRPDGDDHVVITVSDDGPGMPEEVRERVFEPFFTTKEVGKGTGQGLAVCHSVITDRHAGEISVASEPGVGTTFTIRLPVVGAADAAEVAA